MTLATKNGALIVQGGKIAENCNCCCAIPEYGKFEWLGSPPPAPSAFAFGTDTDAGFCACYWDTGIPMVKSQYEPCGALGGVPHAGLHHSRKGNTAQSSLESIDGSASGYPTYQTIDELKLTGQVDMNWPGTSYANASLFATQSALYLPGNILIGIHSQQGGHLVGATVANSVIPGSGHAYKISAITKSDAETIRQSQYARSLKYCNGGWIADPDRPWKVRVDVAGPPLTSFTDVQPWSHEFECNSLVTSSSGMPILWTHTTSGSLGGQLLNQRFNVWEYGRGTSTAITPNSLVPQRLFTYSVVRAASPECDSCAVKVRFSGTISRRTILTQTETLTAWYSDTVYFDDITSPCVTQAPFSWSVRPTRRYFTFFDGFDASFEQGSFEVGPNVSDLVTFSI